MNNISTEKSLASQLFCLFKELLFLIPDFEEWNYNCLKSIPPRLIRLQRLQALFRALRINWNPAGFPKGEFITNNLEMYKDYDSKIFDDLITFSGSKPAFSYEYFPIIFEKLFEYRIKVEKPLIFNKGLLAIGDSTTYSYFAISNLNISIKQVIAPLDKLLILLIDPVGYEYEEEELIKYFDYPTDDLKQIDVDWT